MVAKNQVEGGAEALHRWLRDPDGLSRAEMLAAVRFTLFTLERNSPGRAVEVRVPPAGAVQVMRGTTHRRGTPPAVVEMDMQTWLRLATGQITWEAAEEEALVDASGERADLSPLLPLV